MLYLYIHGFGSSGRGQKALLFKKYFGAQHFFAPSLPYIPSLAIETLEGMISHLRPYHDITLIGSSLGGYYASYLASKFDLKAVLINPSVFPYKTLAKNIGMNQSYHDSSDYAFIQAHIDSLKAYEVTQIDLTKFMVLLQKGDEVLDYQEAKKRYQGCLLVIEEGGSHSFDGIEGHFDAICSFATKS